MTPIQLYKKLYASFGSQHWWPASSRFEVIVGAILTQSTSWNNVEKAIKNLRKAKLLNSRKIASAKKQKIAGLIKPALYFNQKALYLQEFCRYLGKNYNHNLNKLFSKELPALRKELLSLKGIGEETADSIILYAAEKPIFVVDAYTKRILKRIYGKGDLGYVEVQSFFHSALPKNTKLFNEFHALLVKLGKDYCKKNNPLCRECPVLNSCDFNKPNKNEILK
ncbi:MAG: endonuclease III domain-containing protein [archaeon]|nr:endonuclease III domain-containing protein [Candidatus Micrarchaeota archaeon]